jgi:hypothetical protein
MTTGMSRWVGLAAAVALGILGAAVALGHQASLAEAAAIFAAVVGYPVLVLATRWRVDVGTALSGQPRDERWESIHLRALSVAAQALAVLLAAAFLVTLLEGGDAAPYAWLGAGFVAAYIVAVVWYRARS